MVRLKGLLRRGSSEEEEEPVNYFMQGLVINRSKYFKSGNNQAFRIKMVQFFSGAEFSFALDSIATLLNAATVIWYILFLDMIHFHTDDPAYYPLGDVYLYFLKIAHVFFFFDFILRLMTNKNPTKFLLSVESVVEIVTIVPFLSIVMTSDNIDADEVRFCMVLDTLRCILCKRIFDQPKTLESMFPKGAKGFTEKRETADLMLIIITSIVFPAAFLTWNETLAYYPNMVSPDSGVNNSFWHQVYFILTTMSLVGYGT